MIAYVIGAVLLLVGVLTGGGMVLGVMKMMSTEPVVEYSRDRDVAIMQGSIS